MSDRTVSELYDDLVAAAAEDDHEAVVQLAGRIQSADAPVTDLLEQFETALKNEEYDKARRLVDKIKGRYAEVRVEDRATSERVTHVRDTTDLSRAERDHVASYLDTDLAASMERVAFIADATAFLGQPEAGDREQVVEDAADLRERERELARKQEQMTGMLEDLTAPPALDVVAVDSGSPNPPAEPFPVTATVANMGDDPAEGVQASVDPGDGLTVVDEPDGIGRIGGNERYETTASLRADREGTFEFEVRVRAETGGSALERVVVEIEQGASVEREGSGGRLDWLPIAGGVGALGLGAGAAEYLRRRRGEADDSDEGPADRDRR